MPHRRIVLPLAAALAILSTSTGCDILANWVDTDAIGGIGAYAPVVGLGERQATLVKYPGLHSLGLYACQRLLGAAPCLLLGPPPSKASLEFQFQVVFHIDNPNRVPVPATELLVALQVWPDQTFGDLGAVCTTLCEPAADGCPIPPGEACVDRTGDVKDLDSFLEAALRGAITLAWEAATGQPVGGQLEAWTVGASDRLDLTFTFSIGIDPMLKLIQAAADDVLVQVLQTGGGELVIPYAIGGKLWFQVPYLGRVAVGVGPFGAPPSAPLTWKVL
jgi:hypothetical protein